MCFGVLSSYNSICGILGSGRTLMASSRIGGSWHHYFGIDIDHTCVKMTSLNLFLSGLFQSEVMCANALLPSDFRISYKTSFHTFGLFRIQDSQQSPLWHSMQYTVAKKNIPKQNPPDFRDEKKAPGSQLIMF